LIIKPHAKKRYQFSCKINISLQSVFVNVRPPNIPNNMMFKKQHKNNNNSRITIKQTLHAAIHSAYFDPSQCCHLT